MSSGRLGETQRLTMLLSGEGWGGAPQTMCYQVRLLVKKARVYNQRIPLEIKRAVIFFVC